jgi:hypothetical protein
MLQYKILVTHINRKTYDVLGTWDFFGLNHYTTVYGASGEEGPIPSISRDAGVITSQDFAWYSTGSPWLKVSYFLFFFSALKH